MEKIKELFTLLGDKADDVLIPLVLGVIAWINNLFTARFILGLAVIYLLLRIQKNYFRLRQQKIRMYRDELNSHTSNVNHDKEI